MSRYTQEDWDNWENEWVIPNGKAANGHMTYRIIIPEITKWLTDLAVTTPSTSNRYDCSIRYYLEWLWEQEPRIHPFEAERETIVDYVKSRQNDFGHKTLDTDYSALSKLYENLIDTKTIAEEDDPFWRLTRGKLGIKQKTLKDDAIPHGMYAMPRSEFDATLEQVPTDRTTPYKLIYRLMWSTGLRCDDISGIELKHIDEDDKRIWIPERKTTTTGYCYVPFQLWPDFHLWWKSDRANQRDSSKSDHLFLGEHGTQLSTSTISEIWREAARDAGINERMFKDAAGRWHWKITGHCLRPSFAVQSYRNGTRQAKIQKLLRHKDPAMTAKYLALADEDLERAVRATGAGHNPGQDYKYLNDQIERT